MTEPTPLDPTVTNAWATILNTNFSLLDSAVAGIGAIALPAQAGYPTVVLTSNSGAADQARNQGFTFTGVLTAATLVLWPPSLTRFFSVTNNTTGSFVLTIGVSNGSGGAAGTTQVVAQGQTVQFQSDGTNITLRSADASSLRGRLMASTAPTDGQALVWVAANTDWEPGNPSFPASPTFVAPILGNATCTTLNKLTLTEPATGATLTLVDGTTVTGPPLTNTLGYLDVPSNPQSANYTTVLADRGRSIDHPSTDANARTFTIDGSLAYPVGTCISFSNMAAQVLSIAMGGTDAMYLAGSGTTATRSLAQYGTATARKYAAGVWLISGVGLT